MRVYLDVSCLNRPFDDQEQMRIRLEAEAVAIILEKCDRQEWQQVSSTIAQIEIDAIADFHRRQRVRLLLPSEKDIMMLTEPIFDRASSLGKLGFKPADALHVAAAEKLNVDVFLSCDDRLCRAAWRARRELRVDVANPLDWLKKESHGENS